MWHSYSTFYYSESYRCEQVQVQGLLMWHPHRAGFIVKHTDVKRCQDY